MRKRTIAFAAILAPGLLAGCTTTGGKLYAEAYELAPGQKVIALTSRTPGSLTRMATASTRWFGCGTVGHVESPAEIAKNGGVPTARTLCDTMDNQPTFAAAPPIANAVVSGVFGVAAAAVTRSGDVNVSADSFSKSDADAKAYGGTAYGGEGGKVINITPSPPKPPHKPDHKPGGYGGKG